MMLLSVDIIVYSIVVVSRAMTCCRYWSEFCHVTFGTIDYIPLDDVHAHNHKMALLAYEAI